MNDSTIIEVVNKLIGATMPVGDTRVDDKRLENVKKLGALYQHLDARMKELATYSDRHEFSMQEIGEEAARMLREVDNEK